jgi:Ni,Fe-hydrogenase maturation factor
MHLLELVHALYGCVPCATTITVGPINLEHAEQLSPQVASSIPKVLKEIQQVMGVST